MINIDKYAALFQLLCENFDAAETGKKVTQKIFYFFEREGIELNLRYGIHFYGPYSAKLDNVMHILESEDYISIDTTKPTHVITALDKVISEDILTDNEVVIANKVLGAFSHKSPLELEALATMDYIAKSILHDASKDDIIRKFKEIKGNKFNEKVIESAYIQLCNLELIGA